ncbi:hypothetical protein HY025_02220 [Candidatus Daviesbacteria bacterium]|nr:hypothetical protein [Candidatus Daviesbacteria bacterium]
MSVFNNIFAEARQDGAQQLGPNILAACGPILTVEISIPTSLAEVYTKENKQIPQPKIGWALIDTGATKTCVDDDVLTQLGVNPIDRTSIHGSSGKHEVNIFPAHMRFPTIPNFELDFSSAIGVNIQAQQVGGQPIIALLGRDILSRCLFVYNGPLGIYTISF